MTILHDYFAFYSHPKAIYKSLKISHFIIYYHINPNNTFTLIATHNYFKSLSQPTTSYLITFKSLYAMLQYLNL